MNKWNIQKSTISILPFSFAGGSHPSKMYPSYHCSGACADPLCTGNGEDPVFYDKERVN